MAGFCGGLVGTVPKRLHTPERDQAERAFEQIIGKSPALESVLAQVERVAPTDSTILIQGETGTGKELIARAIHNASPRCGHALIKLNCAAIPLDILESELFGQDKGAVTGAATQKIGRFEMADKGTLFLDEVGDIPLALQPKLLSVLQEQRFESQESGRGFQVDVRLIAATNRDLEEMVARGEFRSDLYYRLNVFPISLPPLRERREDIPALVEHFVEMFNRRMGGHIRHIPAETMAAFSAHSWPGNTRELRNLVERAVILARDGALPNPLPTAAVTVTPSPSIAPGKTMGPASPNMAKAGAKEFPPFRLDMVNECLWHRRDGSEQRICLTPKAFAILRYLVEHAGRLVTQTEMLEAVWPDTFVQPEVLKSHIFDVRHILGDDPKSPRFIETLPRRGYQFIAPVGDAPA